MSATGGVAAYEPLRAGARRADRARGAATPAWLAVVAVALLALEARGADPDRAEPLWPSPRADRAERRAADEPDGHQLVAPELPLGQSFRPVGSELFRIELSLHNRDDPRPARFRLWRFAGSPRATRAAVPLFEDAVGMATRGRWMRVSVFPRLELQPDATYYFELSAERRDAFEAQVVRARPGRSDERAWVGDAPLEGGARRLWFRTFAPGQEAAALGAEASRARGASAARGVSDWRAPGPEPERVTREDYLARVRDYADASRVASLRGCGRLSADDAFFDAFLYTASCREGRCDEARARNAAELLLHAERWQRCDFPAGRGGARCERACRAPRVKQARFLDLELPARAYEWIRGSPSLDPSGHARIRRLLLGLAGPVWKDRWRGSFNRSVVAAASLGRLAKLHPDAPGAEGWSAYARDVWGDFRSHFETEEDSASYSALVWWPGILELMQVVGAEDAAWSDPGFRALVERFAAEVTPAGFVSGYGDGSGFGFDAPELIWLFEAAAARWREPELRWLARRIFAFHASRAPAPAAGRDAWERSLRGLAFAYLAADPKLAARAPTRLPSQRTMRTEAIPRPRAQWGSPPRYADFGHRKVYDKLVLHGGPDPDDMHALFTLLSGYRHGHESLGALSLLMDQGSVLLSETAFPYARHQIGPEDESIALARRYWGGSPEAPGRSVEFVRFDERERVTVAWLRWRDSGGWGIQQERHIYFLKNRALWVRDRFHVPAGMTARVGTVWHAAGVSPLRGAHWFNVYQQRLLRNVWNYRNPERYALVYLHPAAGAEVALDYRAEYAPLPTCPPGAADREAVPKECRGSPPWVIHQHRVLDGERAETAVFDSVVVPWRTPVDAGDPEGEVGVDVLRSGSGAQARLRIGVEEWLLLDAGAGTPAEAGRLRSDAAWAIVMRRPGVEPWVSAADASWLTSDALRLEWPERRDVESGPLPPLDDGARGPDGARTRAPR